ncbi:hypothetical protein AAFF_G00259640 [Aldrovandia affinis]|uniref:Uncharacterized protein n=1 Tax=Aldrovandia affinis TaxID=143900 RepID=A0AAD7W2X1_9TELE|nr:hypothetical protein AAFF_G00259640 [Aldrovandia affinis]
METSLSHAVRMQTRGYRDHGPPRAPSLAVWPRGGRPGPKVSHTRPFVCAPRIRATMGNRARAVLIALHYFTPQLVGWRGGLLAFSLIDNGPPGLGFQGKEMRTHMEGGSEL